MANNLLSRGQALSLIPYSGSQQLTAQTIFVDSTDANAKRTVRIQGFRWVGESTLKITDSNGTVLFNRISTKGTIWPNGASGSAGLVTTTPLYLTNSGTWASQGGKLIVYGEVL